jgi:hypothetical protein
MVKGYIYKIICEITNLVYIGSTTKSIETRLKKHEYDYIYYCEGKRCYCASYKILENGKFKIELIEEIEFQNKKELLEKERYYIENTNCVNIITPSMTHQESYKNWYDKSYKIYYDNNKEKENERKRKEYEKNKEKINERRRELYKLKNIVNI